MPGLTFPCVAMASELQELRDLVQQLLADKKQLLSEQAQARSSQSAPGPSRVVPPCNDGNIDCLPTERLLCSPRERKCPLFKGTTGFPVEDWVEEERATIRARHLRPLD